jgi:GLPGLI family protein
MPNQVWEDRKILLVGDSIQHFYSDYKRRSDSAVTILYNKGKAFKSMTFSGNIKVEKYDIYTYPVKGTRTVWKPITDLSLYRYVETMEKPQWLIEADTCTILSFSCQKAIANFRGRDWEVWFTMEIPIDAGPWKLYGLPGLILKASDSRSHYVFECIGLESLSKKNKLLSKLQVQVAIL